jgi:hypothetical protein
MDLDAGQGAELFPVRAWTLLERALFAIGIKSLWIDEVEPPRLSRKAQDVEAGPQALMPRQSSTR